MTEIERIKLAVKTLISLGVAKNQEEIGKLMGYSNKSSFSQVVNGVVPLPEKFIDKLCKLDSRLRKSWIVNEIGDILINKNESKQVYINENIDIEKYYEERELERQKKYPNIYNLQYKELAEARLEIINSKNKTIELLEIEIKRLKEELVELKKDKSISKTSSNITK